MGAYFTDPTTGYQHLDALNAVVLAATTNGIEIDTRGFDGGWIALFVNVGTVVGSGATMTVTVEETDVTGFGGTVTAVTGALFTVIDSDIAGTFNKVHAGAILIHGRQRFLRLVFTESGTWSGPTSAVAIMTGAHESPLVDSVYDFNVTT